MPVKVLKTLKITAFKLLFKHAGLHILQLFECLFFFAILYKLFVPEKTINLYIFVALNWVGWMNLFV